MTTSRAAIVVDAGELTADVSTIDALARLQLYAQRIGQSIRLRGASAELRELIDVAGLSEVLRVEPQRQAEQREEALRVEKERQLPDAAA